MRNPRQAPLKIDFIIVGGGLSGLSAAYTLASAGHRVRVLDKLPGDAQWTGGIQVPPNLTKILFEWGLEAELRETCWTMRNTYCCDLDTGETIAYMPWAEEVQAESGAPFYTMQHRELHTMLRGLALSVGVEVVPDAQVVSASPAPSAPGTHQNPLTAASRPSVNLRGGEKLFADVIVGADGPFSVVRQSVETEPTVPRWDGSIHFSGVIPMKTLDEEEDLRNEDIARGDPLWCGAHNAVIGFPVSKEKEFAVHLWYRSLIPDIGEGWLATLSPDHFKHRLVKLMNNLTSVSWVRRLSWPKLEDWVDDSAHIVLIGDAARPTEASTLARPFFCRRVLISRKTGTTHNVSTAIESSVVLGTLFSHLRSHDEISTLLYAYQELRQPRAQALEDLESLNATFRFMPPGPARDARNERMKEFVSVRREPWKTDQFSQQWWQNYAVWTYDAFDAADDWWKQWSTLKKHSIHGKSDRSVGNTASRFVTREVTVECTE
ncbi:hypothetical protein OF83DRAFT_1171604 [Amylostereum chailletii]|nr:hypothetical protein OF83DRAFT_1171604 [Amylostereum chailletii]